MLRSPALAALVATSTLALAGCGDGGRSPTGTADTRPQRQASTLPSGWTRLVQSRAGFSIGLPPGWRFARMPRVTVVRAPNRAVSAFIALDASKNPASLESYAQRTMRQLESFEDLEVGRASPLPRAAHPTAIVVGRGIFRATGVPQRIVLATVRPPGRPTYSLLFFRNGRPGAAAYNATISRMIRSFRARAPRRG